MKILVPSDFSEPAKNALMYAIELSKPANAFIVLLHALDSPAGDIEHSVCESKLKSLQKIVSENGISCKTACMKGPAEDVICKYQESDKISLIVMGNTGESNFEKALFGSTATNIIEKANCPVLAVPAGISFTGLRHVSFATSFRMKEIDAIKSLASLVKSFGAKLELVHVFPGDELTELQAKETEEFKTYIRENTDSLSIEFKTLAGNNTEIELKEYVLSGKVDLLAVSAHHRSLWDKLFGESLTNHISSANYVPLLVFHYNKASAVKLF